VERSTFGLEYVAAKMAVEMIEGFGFDKLNRTSHNSIEMGKTTV
jgi:hypothetical protein